MSLVDPALAVDSNFVLRGDAADYFPQGGPPLLGIKVIRTRPPVEGPLGPLGIRMAAEQQAEAETADVRVSEVPLAKKNDRLVITGVEQAYRVKAQPVLDRLKQVWHLDLIAEGV